MYISVDVEINIHPKGHKVNRKIETFLFSSKGRIFIYRNNRHIRLKFAELEHVQAVGLEHSQGQKTDVQPVRILHLFSRPGALTK